MYQMNFLEIIEENNYDLYKSHSIIYSIKKKEKSPDRKDFKHFDTALIILLIHLCFDMRVGTIKEFEDYFRFNLNKNIIDNIEKFKNILKTSTIIQEYGIDIILIPNLSKSLDFILCFGDYLFYNQFILEKFAMNYYGLAFSSGNGHIISLKHDLLVFKEILDCNAFVLSKVMEHTDIRLIASRHQSNYISLLSFLEDDSYECFIVLFSQYFEIKTNEYSWEKKEFYNLWRMVCKYDSVRIGKYIFDYFYQGLSKKSNAIIQKVAKIIDFNLHKILKLAIGGISLKILHLLFQYLPESMYKGSIFKYAFTFDNITKFNGQNEKQIADEKLKRNLVIQLLTAKSITLDNEICELEQIELAHHCFFKGDVGIFLESKDSLLVTAMESDDQDSLNSLLVNFGTPIHQLQTLSNSDQLLHFIQCKPNSVATLFMHLEKGVAHNFYCSDVEDIVPLIFFSLNSTSFRLFQQLCVPYYPRYYAETSSLSKIQSKYNGIFNVEKFNRFLVSHTEKRITIDEFIKYMCDNPDKYLNNLRETVKIFGYEIMLTNQIPSNHSNLSTDNLVIISKEIKKRAAEEAETDLLNDLENEEKLKKQKEKEKKQKQKLKHKEIDQKKELNKKQQQQEKQKEVDNIKLKELQLQQQKEINNKKKQQKPVQQQQKQKQQQKEINGIKQKEQKPSPQQASSIIQQESNNNITTNNNTTNNITTTTTGNNKKKQVMLIDKMDKDYFEIGKFQFIRNESNIIGRGSNGTLVFKGIWSNKVPVAIKQMQKAFCNCNQITKEIEALITITSKNCSNMIRYIDKEEDGLFVYLGLTLCNGSLQELIDKNTLQQFINSSKHGDCLKLFGDIINGIQFLHSNDMVHNDLNPRNILCHDGSFIISDLGLSKMEVEVSFSYTQNSGAVPTGQGGYHPSEVLEDKRKTKSVDIFSLGCILFVMLTNGQHPFGPKLYRVVNILMDKPDLKPLQNNLFACDLISSMISKEESKRPLIQQVSSHPLFWLNDYKIKFIDAAFNLNKDQQNNSLKKLLNGSADGILFLSSPWNLAVDQILLSNDESSITNSPLIKKANYQYDQVYDLIRFIRNTIQHHKDISKSIQQQKSQSNNIEILVHLNNPESVLLYFESKIPHLIYHLYQQLKQFPNNSDYLNSFFTSQQQQKLLNK